MIDGVVVVRLISSHSLSLFPDNFFTKCRDSTFFVCRKMTMVYFFSHL